MIYKEIDPKDNAIKELETILESDVNKAQLKNMQTEVNRIKKGIAGERQAAYHINQIYQKSYVAHDLRLNVDGEIAQIDHIVINKFDFGKVLKT